MPMQESFAKTSAVVGPAAVVYTADAGGDTTHTVDAALVEVDDYWNNRYIKYLTGDNAGLERLITDFDALTDTLTHDAFPNTCDAGDTYNIGGWVNPRNAERFDNSYAYTETDAAEQSYTGFDLNLVSVETLDKVFVRLKHTSTTTTVLTGDTATATMTLRVYDGSTWTNFQVAKQVLAVTTVNDESFTDTIGDNSNVDVWIDVSSVINTAVKLSSVQLRLLFAVTADAGATVKWSVDGLSLAAFYSIVSGIPATAEATTKFSHPKIKRALNTLKQTLNERN